MTKISKDDLPVEVVEYIDALEAHVDDLDATIAKQDETITTLSADKATNDVSKADADLTEILKSADPAVAAVIRKQAEDNKAMAERISKQEAADLDRTMIAKAAALPHVGSDETPTAEVLKGAYAVSTEFGEKVEAILKAANEQIETSDLFKELGGGGGESTVSQSVDAAAAEIRKADPSLTREQAIAKAYETNPALYAEATKEG